MSTHSFDDSGGKDGYDPSSLLKSAVDKSKTKGSPMTSREEKYFYKGKEPRPSGRDERGGDRAVSRAMVDADRSLKGRDRDRERYADPVLRLSEEDIKRYEFLQRRREERERELSDLSLQVGLIFIFLTLFQTLNLLSPPP